MNSIPVDAITLPAINDAQSIQQALSRIIQAVAAGTLDNTRARILLSALKLAMTNLRSLAAEDKAKAQQTEASATPKATITEPAITATQTPENAPQHFILGNPAAPSATIAPVTGSNISAAARYREKLQAAAMARSQGVAVSR